MLKNLLKAAVFCGLVFGSGAAFTVPAAAQSCLSPAEARAAVQSRQAIPLSQIRGKISREAGGEVVSAQLCTANGGQYVYLVNVLSRGGEVKRLTVDAGSGNILGY
jgi:uncharacterized membrane protein YkoI